ncbi:MAG: hypothetical protein EGP89_01355 [Ruminococcaceae bacterium]|nr:hypothetical protein [Oscillospiraceae bacterium]
MKRVLAMVLCLAMMLVMTSVAVFAMDEVTIIGATMQDPKPDFQGTPENLYDKNYGGVYVYGWNDATAKRGATLELEKAVTLENCYITWGHPSWADYDQSASDYTISVSADGEEFTEIYSVKGLEGLGLGKQRTDTITFETPAENVKYVQLNITKGVGNYLGIAEVRFNVSDVTTTTSSEAASSEETSSVAETSSEAASSEVASSEATSSAVTSSAATSSEAVSSEAESSVATTDNEPKSMAWLWIVIAAVVVVVVVVIVLTSKKKK